MIAAVAQGDRERRGHRQGPAEEAGEALPGRAGQAGQDREALVEPDVDGSTVRYSLTGGTDPATYLLTASPTAADVTPAWADGLEAEEVTVVPWPAADRTVVFITANAEGTRAGQPISDALTGLSWTDADGVRQEWKP